jgi:ferritin-like metal-binding protein YciE
METMDSIQTLLEDQLKDLYSAENQLLKALPKMAKAASSPTLQQAFEDHLEETRQQVRRLQEIGEQLGFKLGGKKCHGMMGLIEEAQEYVEADGEEEVIDSGLIAAAQRVEHYEVSGYGTARTFAERLGLNDVAQLLEQSLEEESNADEKLTQISEGELLPNATLRSEGGKESDEGSDFMAESSTSDETKGSASGRRPRSSASSARGGGSRAGSRKSSGGRGTRASSATTGSARTTRSGNRSRSSGSRSGAQSRGGGSSRARSGARTQSGSSR